MSSKDQSQSSSVSADLNHPLIAALPDNYGAVSCDTYKTYRPILQAAIPIVSKLSSKIGTALQYVMQIADAYCNCSDSAGVVIDARRVLADTILNKVVADADWRAALLANPAQALASTGLGDQVEAFRKTNPPVADCAFSCIVST